MAAFPWEVFHLWIIGRAYVRTAPSFSSAVWALGGGPATLQPEVKSHRLEVGAREARSICSRCGLPTSGLETEGTILPVSG